MDWTPTTFSRVHGSIISFQEVTNPNYRLPGTGPGAIHNRPTISVHVAVMRRLPPLPCFLHANDEPQSHTQQVSGYLHVSLMPCVVLLLWMVSVLIV